jgi:plastocyanin
VSDPIGISIVDFDFTPAGEISPGSPIAVTNLDSADHTLTATDGSFDTRALGLNEVASIAAPAVAGTYEFFCEIHPSMTGQLVVS